MAILLGWTLRGTSHGFLNVFLGLVSFRRRLLRDGSTITANFLQHPHFNSFAVSAIPYERFFIRVFFFYLSLKRLVMQVLYKLKCFHNIKSISIDLIIYFKTDFECVAGGRRRQIDAGLRRRPFY